MKSSHNSVLGKKGESIAADYLEKNNYTILQINYKIRYGEIDVIAIDNSQKEKVLVFVEVKTRTSAQFGTPLDAITPWKLKAVIKTAEYYKLSHKNLPELLRIDAIAVEEDQAGIIEIDHIKNITGF